MPTTVFIPTHDPHRRYNPLSGEWILVSPHRTERPWQGQLENNGSDTRPEYDPNCYLCPGNKRAGIFQNPKYNTTFMFTNDFAALLPDTPPGRDYSHPLFQLESIQGTSRVLCFSPRHDLSLAQMSPENIRGVVDLWAEQISVLGTKYRWVQVFENKGAIMGCSNSHPHGQVWASNAVPDIPNKEDIKQNEFFNKYKKPLLLDYLEIELQSKERLVIESKEWAVIVPFWAIWPFETILIPRNHILRLPELNNEQRDDLSDILKRLLCKYDNLFETSFPYSMGWHGAPTGNLYPNSENLSYWQLHAHFMPPLLRSATVKKFMVGYEMLAEPQRDLTPEQAAYRLRSLSEVHYASR
ncbi:MAG: UDP-glucose--hexose-1-phosphate uridylyltransferase [Chloroflexota bacterium]